MSRSIQIKEFSRDLSEVKRKLVIKANYSLGRFKQAVWLIGDGRSGTTWVSDLINWDKHFREMFEPFHPRFVDQMRFLSFHEYIRPDDITHPLTHIAADVFSGKFTNARVDESNNHLFYHGLLIKDIFANLFACWIARQYPNLKIVFLVRNPFAVALSKLNKRHWIWMTDPKEFLKQPALRDDYLQPFEDQIRVIGDDYIDRQILIWAIIHFIPFNQFNLNSSYILFYEDLLVNPREELQRLFLYTRPDIGTSKINEALDKFERPSRVSDSESVIDRSSRIDNWKTKLSADQIKRGLDILKKFSLNDLYNEGGTPNRAALKHFPCQSGKLIS